MSQPELPGLPGLPGPSAVRYPAPARRRHVAFRADRPPATVPLTWAQQHIMLLFEALHPATEGLNVKFRCSLRDGVREDEVLAQLKQLTESFDALRAVYCPPPAGPAQRVLQDGELAVDIVDAGEACDDRAANDIMYAAGSVPFDIARELPLRTALVTVAGEPRYLVFTCSHLMVDFTSTKWIKFHLRELLADPPALVHGPAAPAYQPADVIDWERSPAGQRTGARAMAEYEATLRVIPQTMLPRMEAEPDGPRYRYVQLNSPALALAVPWLASRHSVSSTAVLSAGICAISGFASGLDRAYLQLTLANRVGARTVQAIGMFIQDGLVCLDLADASIADLIAAAAGAVMRAARSGRYPPADLAVRRQAVEAERGVAFDMSCWLNSRRAEPWLVPASVSKPDPGLLADAQARACLRTFPGAERSTSTFFVFADTDGAALQLTMLIDATLLPEREGLGWLRAIERVLCAAVTTEVGAGEIGGLTDLAPPDRDDDWCLTGAGWAHLPTVTSLVRAAAGTRHAGVYAQQAPGGAELVAYLDGAASDGATSDGGASDRAIARLHTECVARLPGIRTAVAPHRYVVCAGAPARPSLAAWSALPVLAESSGRVAPARDAMLGSP